MICSTTPFINKVEIPKILITITCPKFDVSVSDEYSAKSEYEIKNVCCQLKRVKNIYIFFANVVFKDFFDIMTLHT